MSAVDTSSMKIGGSDAERIRKKLDKLCAKAADWTCDEWWRYEKLREKERQLIGSGASASAQTA